MRKKLLFLLIAMTTLVCAGCSSSLYEKTEKGYVNVVSVNGAAFDIPSSFLSTTAQPKLFVPVSKPNIRCFMALKFI